jgi:hypothetical protein
MVLIICIFSRIWGALDHLQSNVVEEYHNCVSIFELVIYHVFRQFITYLNLVELHNAFHLISNFLQQVYSDSLVNQQHS